MAVSVNIDEIHRRINFKGTVQRWAQFTVADWLKEQQRLKIGRTKNLARSFKTTTIFGKDAVLIEVRFSYRYYGRFVDMGVGKGTKIGDVAENRITRGLLGRKAAPRRAKKWYSRKFYFNAQRLPEILAGKFAYTGQQLVIQEFKTISSI